MSNKSTKTAAPKAEELSRKEMEDKRAEVTAYYKDSIKHLKVQLEYETVLKDIEAARAERIQSQMFVSQVMAGPDKEQAPEQQPQTSGPGAEWNAGMSTAPPRRTLKSVED